MRGQEIQCLQNNLQDVAIYLQPFPSYLIGKPVRRLKLGEFWGFWPACGYAVRGIAVKGG